MKKALLITLLLLAGFVVFSQTSKKANKAAPQNSTADPDYDFNIKSVSNSTTIDTLKKLLLNKTLWIRYYAMDAYDPATKKYAHFVNDNFNYQPVKVVDVALSNFYLNPYRIFLQSKTGTTYFYDFEVDPDKKYGELVDADDKHPLPYGLWAERQRISNWFFTFNPITKYHLTPAEATLIRHATISIGMRDKVVELIKGKPKTTNYSPGLMQWVYEDESRTTYYYFSDNGRLTSYN